MATRRTSFKQSDITRLLKAAAAAGLKTKGCRLNPHSGEIELNFDGDSKAHNNSFDAIMGAD